jgi:hypothetical protein
MTKVMTTYLEQFGDLVEILSELPEEKAKYLLRCVDRPTLLKEYTRACHIEFAVKLYKKRYITKAIVERLIARGVGSQKTAYRIAHDARLSLEPVQ